jgi:MraZ protein
LHSGAIQGSDLHLRVRRQDGQETKVSRRFRGESQHKVDTKGRVSIPASFRRVLETSDPNWKNGETPELVIVYGDHRRSFLECYTMAAIEEVDAKIDAMPRGSMQRKMLQALFHGQSFPTTVDDTGRLVLPAKLRSKIALEGEAFFIGMGDTFQIWNPETYDTEERAKQEAWLDQLPEDFDPMQFLDGPAGA